MLLILESLPTVIGTAAVAPALLFLWLVIATDERPGPPIRVWGAFFLGAASISLLGLARAPFAKMLVGTGHPWLDQALHSLFGVAAPEEIVKVLVIVAVSVVRRRTYADPMDTVVYGAAAGLGFAAYENLAYLVQHPDIWRALAALRSVLTVPFHGALGIIAGAYLAIARAGTALGANRHNRDWARISSYFMVLAGPIALHAAFDFPLLLLQKGGLDPTTRMVLGASQRVDRRHVDRVRRAPGAAGRPSSRPAHRGRARTPQPVAADVGAAGVRRRRRLCRGDLRAGRGPPLADESRPQPGVGGRLGRH